MSESYGLFYKNVDDLLYYKNTCAPLMLMWYEVVSIKIFQVKIVIWIVFITRIFPDLQYSAIISWYWYFIALSMNLTEFFFFFFFLICTCACILQTVPLSGDQ